jgi:hypothetical protein
VWITGRGRAVPARQSLGKQCISQKALGPGTRCPASWTTPPEWPEDGPARGATQAQSPGELFLCALSITPLIVPPTWVYPAARCGGLWCAFAHADKFICMGNRKNRLTATKVISRHARTRRRRPSRGRQRRRYREHRRAAAAGAGVRPPVRPLQPLGCGSPFFSSSS